MNEFNDSHVAAIQLADIFCTSTSGSAVVIRDLLGRHAILVTPPKNNFDSSIWDSSLSQLKAELKSQCSPFLGSRPVMKEKDLYYPEAVTHSPDIRPAPFTVTQNPNVRVLDRMGIGAAWTAPTTPTTAHRVAFYGFKGGVGRSTAAFHLANHLRKAGHRVLVVDLDLESPGISTMLCPDVNSLPEHGVLDHLVEYAVNPDVALNLVKRAPVFQTHDSQGEVWFCSAEGRPRPGLCEPSLVDKLSRAYLDLPELLSANRPPMRFGDRLEATVRACEREMAQAGWEPDIVILDSRSGIHDIAAVAITQLSNTALLFATDDEQTWRGYEGLFKRWQVLLSPGERDALRRKLQMVAALAKAGPEISYINDFADRSQQLFADSIYDEVIPCEDSLDTDNIFNFEVSQTEAPHYPIPIYFHRDFYGEAPISHLGYDDAGHESPFKDFLTMTTELLFSRKADNVT